MSKRLAPDLGDDAFHRPGRSSSDTTADLSHIAIIFPTFWFFVFILLYPLHLLFSFLLSLSLSLSRVSSLIRSECRASKLRSLDVSSSMRTGVFRRVVSFVFCVTFRRPSLSAADKKRENEAKTR